MNNEKLKKLSSKKITLGFSALLAMTGCVLVGSIFPFVLNPSKIFTQQFISNEIFIAFLVIYCMVVVMGMGQAGNQLDPKSLIAQSKVKFNTYIEKIIRDPFEQWIEQVLEPRDQNKVYKRVLRKVGIKQPAVVELSRSDLKSLINSPQRIDNVWYDELTEEQYNEVLKIKDGKYNIKFVDPGWYLTDKKIDTELTRSERAIREQVVKARLMRRSLIAKVAMTLIVSLVIGMFVYDMASEQEKATTLFTLFSRLTSMASSSYYGYKLGCEQNDIDAAYIEMKADTMKEQLEDSGFKAKDIQDIAKEKFAKKVKDENEKLLQVSDDKELLSIANRR